MELTLDEVVVLSVVDTELPMAEVADRAVDLWPCTKFDKVLARATALTLVERGFLYQDYNRVGPTAAGKKALAMSWHPLEDIFNALQDRINGRTFNRG